MLNVIDKRWWTFTCLYITAVSALTGSPRMARDGSTNTQTRRARYYYSIKSTNYYYYQATYNAIRQSSVGFARYNRVYSGLKHLKSKYYNQYFTFVRKPDYTVYLRRVHKGVRNLRWKVCKALTGSPRMARDGSTNTQTRRARYYYSIKSTNYYYYQATYNAIRQSSVGFARYNRVYSGLKHLKSKYYNQYFTFVRKPDYTVYLRRVHKEISVCRNFEANENGTYLGIYTCPLPFEPGNYAYCCGETNAEYCCPFQQSSINVIGAFLVSLFFICPVVCILYAVQKWCTKEARLQRAIRKRWRKAIERVMDRDKKEELKASLPVADEVLSENTGSVISMSSIGSTDVPQHRNKFYSDEAFKYTSKLSNDTLNDVTDFSDDVMECVSSQDTYPYDIEEVSINNIYGELYTAECDSSNLPKPRKTARNSAKSTPVQRSILSVSHVDGAMDCPGLSRVSIHLPIAWPVKEDNDSTISNGNSSWI